MGLDYRYIIILKTSHRSKLNSRLILDAVINETNFGICATIKFKIDKPILAYLKHIIRRNEGVNLKTTLFFRKSRFKDYFSDDFGKIGCVYIKEKTLDKSNYLFVAFSAATTSMSILFQDSISIKEWFIKLSNEVNALATFLDLEENGYKFIYKDGEEVDLTFVDNDEQSDQDFYKNICKEYERAYYL